VEPLATARHRRTFRIAARRPTFGEMRDRVPTPTSYVYGAATPPVWARPDPSLAAAGIEGESVVARVRMVAMGLLLIAPTYNLIRWPAERMYQTGFAVTIVAALVAIAIWQRLVRGEWRAWIGFASSSFDVSMVSLALLSFFLVKSPMAALNSTVTFEMYFLAITATSLRYDARICIVAGALAIAQYGVLWMAGSIAYDLSDPSFVAFSGPYIPVDLGTRLILLGIATLLAVTLVRRAQRLLYLAARDRLTGLYNRGHFDQALANALDVASRTNQSISLAIIDIDHFKAINDEHGHTVGDQAIRAVADRLLRTMRRTDLVARYGGEEFVVLMPGTPADAAYHRIESVRREFSATPLQLEGGRTLAVNFSAGIAGAPSESGAPRISTTGEMPAPDALLRRADQRLLGAKRAGRGRCVGPPIAGS
jgi:two-component system, cell cycle response regulator